MTSEQFLKEIAQSRVIGIFRDIRVEPVLNIAKSLHTGGVRLMEITLNTKNALSKINKLHERYSDQMYIGAGTVLTIDDAKNASEAGASFLVTPHTDVDL